jgi:enoyl-[acyl-carrier protein] reductase I
MPDGGAIVALDFDARQAWPAYDWMGVAKAALEATARYLARDLGPGKVRVNLVAAGPMRTVAARSIPGFNAMEQAWHQRAPLGWNVRDSEPVARACVALLSDWFPATTGEIVHVDGGAHAVALARGET